MEQAQKEAWKVRSSISPPWSELISVWDSMLSKLDKIGGPESHPHVPVGWAWAMCAPFQWTKAVPSHFGGTRNPLLVHWPNRINGRGEIRSQFHHVIDVVSDHS